MPFTLFNNCNLVESKRNRTVKCSILVFNDKIFKLIFHKPGNEKLIYHLRCIRPDLQIINLENKYVIPGFTDSHTHLLAHGIELQRVDLSKCCSLDECLQKLSTAKNRDIIFGVNWDESLWIKGKKEVLNRVLLDRISRDKPVILRRVCGHCAVCNTKALESVQKHWKIVDRKSGWLYEDAALYLNQIFKPSIEMYKKGLKIAIKEALSLGITSINEITDIAGFTIYQAFKKYLKLRVAIYIQNGLRSAINMGLESNLGDEFLKFAGVKIFIDGSIGARTAALRKPYQNSKNHGKLLISEEKLLSIVKMAQDNSIQLMIHSIGDRSTDLVLNALKLAGLGKNPLRHRLEHLEILDSKQIREIARLNLIASMQPNFLRWQLPGNMYEINLGHRYKNMNCFKTVEKAGIKSILGSDCMPLGPLYGISLLVKHPSDAVRLTPAEAIALYTEIPPYATFDEDKKGKIEEGYFADFVVINKNPLIKENLEGMKILNVVVGGEIVYRAKS
ncbi:MAG: amidohydrolase family protein [candidate division WOR-3 bacterium]